MRFHVVILVLALGFAVWMLSEFVRVGSSSMPPTADRLTVGLKGTAPVLLVAGAAAITVGRKGKTPVHPAVTGLLVAGLLLEVLWAFGVALASGWKTPLSGPRKTEKNPVPRTGAALPPRVIG